MFHLFVRRGAENEEKCGCRKVTETTCFFANPGGEFPGGDGVSPKPGLPEDETYPSARGCDIQGKSLSVLLKKMDDKYGKLTAPRQKKTGEGAPVPRGAGGWMKWRTPWKRPDAVFAWPLLRRDLPDGQWSFLLCLRKWRLRS